MDASAFNPSTDITFIIQNNSSIGRSIKVFNTKLNPGGQLDLMKIPGVTEEDIRAEVTKGFLKPLLSGGALKVIQSTVNFSSVDATHNAFLASIGINGGNNAAQLVWYVDPQNASASDTANTGLSASSPLKTLAEVARRLSVIDVNNYTINLLSNTSSTDTFDFNPKFSGNQLANGTNSATVTIVGQQSASIQNGTVVGNGSTTLGTSPSSNTQAQLDGGFAWASYVGKLVVMTSGALAGYTAVVLKDLGGTAARVSNWWNPTGAPGGNGTFASAGNGSGAAPQNGDTFEVRNLTVADGTWRHAGNPIRANVFWKNVSFPSTATLIVEGADIRFVNCQFFCSLTAASGKGQTFNSAFRAFGCLFQPTPGRIATFDCRFRFVGCGILNTSTSVFNTGRMECINSVWQTGQSDGAIKAGRGYSGFGGDTSQNGGQFALFSGTFGCGIFDCAGTGLSISRGAYGSFDAPLYGSGNSVGTAVQEGGNMFIRTGNTPTLTGTTELQVEGAATAIPPLTAGAAVPAASALATWANWAASPFSGNVLNYTTGSSIITAANPD